MGRDRVSRRDRAVEDRLGSAYELLVGFAGKEKGAVDAIPELPNHRLCKLDGAVQVGTIQSDLVEVQEPRSQEGIVIEVAVNFRLGVLISMQEESIPHHLGKNEVDRFYSRFDIARVIGDLAGLCETGKHKPVPRR